MDWKEFQEITAQLFRQLGCVAETNKRVSGARAAHDIDVWITFSIHGIETKWIIECKYWNSNVPKEKILALRTIVEDVGADKGIIVTKTGYQTGAVQATNYTNIKLMTFSELRKVLVRDLPDISRSNTVKPLQPRSSLEILRREIILNNLRNPSPEISAEFYRAFLIESHDQQIQKAAVAGLEKIGGCQAIQLLTERLLDLWGLGAISRTIVGLSKLASDGGILALSATLLIDYHSYYEKLSAVKNACHHLGDQDTEHILTSVLDRRDSSGIHSIHKLSKVIDEEITQIRKTSNNDLQHGLNIGCFFRNRYWADMIQIPNHIEDSIEYTESRFPGLVYTIQQLDLTTLV